jgi:hypothetical protein
VTEQTPPRLAIDGDWLVEDVGRHTCAGGTPESSYAHEPGCGLEPIMTLAELAALFNTVAALGVPINGLPRAVAAAREARDDARGDYELLRDAVIEQLNPRDDDIGETVLMVESIEAAARFIAAQPCACPPAAGPPEWETPCARCQALGRARDERIDR